MPGGIKTLLIDGDVLAYRACMLAEVAAELETFHWHIYVNEEEVRVRIDAEIEFLREKLGFEDYVIALTDSERNFRKDILPTYKHNRLNVRKPVGLAPIRRWLVEESDHETFLRPRLEGDDVLGILQTWPKFQRERGPTAILSIDKDMKTVPGLYIRDLKSGPVEITPEEAERWHMFQTLMGDTTDGYSGCPGVGEKAAREIVENPRRLVRETYIPKRGKDKGKETIRWVEGDPCDLWTAVVDRYAKAGLPEHQALVQARVARILHYSDYDFKERTHKLWTPLTPTIMTRCPT